MAFIDDLARLPVHTRQANATGFLPPFTRMAGHLLFVLADCATEEGHRVLTDDEALNELQHAKDHWAARRTDTPLSTATTEVLGHLDSALTSAIAEFAGWDRDTKIRNLRDLGNRVASLTAVLDRELIGFRDSDAGIAL